MSLSSADLTFTDSSPMAAALLTYQIPAPIDNDYLRVAVFYGVDQLALASATLHSLVGTLPANFS